jgi:hypothetical protein
MGSCDGIRQVSPSPCFREKLAEKPFLGIEAFVACQSTAAGEIVIADIPVRDLANFWVADAEVDKTPVNICLARIERRQKVLGSPRGVDKTADRYTVSFEVGEAVLKHPAVFEVGPPIRGFVSYSGHIVLLSRRDDRVLFMRQGLFAINRARRPDPGSGWREGAGATSSAGIARNSRSSNARDRPKHDRRVRSSTMGPLVGSLDAPL